MTHFQFALACLSALCGVLGASWIVAQSVRSSRTHTEEFQAALIASMKEAIMALAASKRIPEYDSRLQEGDRRMDEIARVTDALQAKSATLGEAMAVQTHSLNNLKQRFEGFDYALNSLREKIDEMPEKIVRMLRNREGK